MRKIICLTVLFITIYSCQPSVSTTTDENAIRQEINALFEHYKNIIETNQFDSLYTLYDKAGVTRGGIGYIERQSINTLKKEYAGYNYETKSFNWIDTRIDILSPTAAVISGKFEWASNLLNDTARSTYTGIVRKTGTEWLIFHEHESWDWSTAKKIAEIFIDKTDSSTANN